MSRTEELSDTVNQPRQPNLDKYHINLTATQRKGHPGDFDEVCGRDMVKDVWWKGCEKVIYPLVRGRFMLKKSGHSQASVYRPVICVSVIEALTHEYDGGWYIVYNVCKEKKIPGAKFTKSSSNEYLLKVNTEHLSRRLWENFLRCGTVSLI